MRETDRGWARTERDGDQGKIRARSGDQLSAPHGNGEFLHSELSSSVGSGKARMAAALGLV